MTLSESKCEALKSGADKLHGHARRIIMAQVVRGLGRGGQRQAQSALGWNRSTIRKGEHELRSGVE
ncbi:MAG: ISAzo13 family transposase, partial [Deltaproteobacteria bacterium]|nr:ISAzo13 family transposase [Deltaproteobacteria bacterium]